MVKILIDTKVIIRNKNTNEIKERYFVGVNGINNKPMYFADGKTSWSSSFNAITLDDDNIMELYNNQ